ncbi:hypothetical protein C0J52_03723 [Blattella germanica]|nr:hypothetical protein C0J52_03723 [Blattella germanica]
MGNGNPDLYLRSKFRTLKDNSTPVDFSPMHRDEPLPNDPDNPNGQLSSVSGFQWMGGAFPNDYLRSIKHKNQQENLINGLKIPFLESITNHFLKDHCKQLQLFQSGKMKPSSGSLSKGIEPAKYNELKDNDRSLNLSSFIIDIYFLSTNRVLEVISSAFDSGKLVWVRGLSVLVSAKVISLTARGIT